MQVETAANAYRGVDLLARLADELRAADVAYCHWKSNAFLEEAARGEGDLDLLVAVQSALAFNEIASKLGFKPFVAPPARAYPGIADFLGVDPASGVLVHLHVYHRLVTGELHLKGYELPWESVMLSTRRVDPQTGLCVLDPNLEMVVFLVREAIKLRTRDRLRYLWVPYWRGRRAGEYEWIRARTRPEEVEAAALRVLTPPIARTLRGMWERRPSVAELWDLQRTVSAALRSYRRFGPMQAIWTGWARELSWAWGGFERRILGRPVPHPRVPVSGGVLIAFLGPDGSGKSTLVRAVQAWLGRKAAVWTVYFGSGDGPASPWRWPLRLAFRVARRGPVAARRGPAETERGWRSLARALWALVLALERRGKLRRAWGARARGMIVLCDRYPQTLVPGHMDGPLLGHWLDHPSRWRRTLARWERVPYEWAAARTPDAVIHLAVSAEVARGRKPEMDPEDVVRRAHSAEIIAHASGARVFSIDADADLDDVVVRVKQAVWSVIRT